MPLTWNGTATAESSFSQETIGSDTDAFRAEVAKADGYQGISTTDAPTAASDVVTFLLKHKFSDDEEIGGPMVCCSDFESSINGYMVELNAFNEGFNLSKWVAGVESFQGAQGTAVITDTKQTVWIKIQADWSVSGTTTIRVKVWDVGDTEPASWQEENDDTSSPLTGENVGLYFQEGAFSGTTDVELSEMQLDTGSGFVDIGNSFSSGAALTGTATITVGDLDVSSGTATVDTELTVSGTLDLADLTASSATVDLTRNVSGTIDVADLGVTAAATRSTETETIVWSGVAASETAFARTTIGGEPGFVGTSDTSGDHISTAVASLDSVSTFEAIFTMRLDGTEEFSTVCVCSTNAETDQTFYAFQPNTFTTGSWRVEKRINGANADYFFGASLSDTGGVTTTKRIKIRVEDTGTETILRARAWSPGTTTEPATWEYNYTDDTVSRLTGANLALWAIASSGTTATEYSDIQLDIQDGNGFVDVGNAYALPGTKSAAGTIDLGDLTVSSATANVESTTKELTGSFDLADLTVSSATASAQQVVEITGTLAPMQAVTGVFRATAAETASVSGVLDVGDLALVSAEADILELLEATATIDVADLAVTAQAGVTAAETVSAFGTLDLADLAVDSAVGGVTYKADGLLDVSNLAVVIATATTTNPTDPEIPDTRRLRTREKAFRALIRDQGEDIFYDPKGNPNNRLVIRALVQREPKPSSSSANADMIYRSTVIILRADLAAVTKNTDIVWFSPRNSEGELAPHRVRYIDQGDRRSATWILSVGEEIA